LALVPYVETDVYLSIRLHAFPTSRGVCQNDHDDDGNNSYDDARYDQCAEHKNRRVPVFILGSLRLRAVPVLYQAQLCAAFALRYLDRPERIRTERESAKQDQQDDDLCSTSC